MNSPSIASLIIVSCGVVIIALMVVEGLSGVETPKPLKVALACIFVSAMAHEHVGGIVVALIGLL